MYGLEILSMIDDNVISDTLEFLIKARAKTLGIDEDKIYVHSVSRVKHVTTVQVHYLKQRDVAVVEIKLDEPPCVFEKR